MQSSVFRRIHAQSGSRASSSPDRRIRDRSFLPHLHASRRIVRRPRFRRWLHPRMRANNESLTSTPDAATTRVFTEDPLSSGTTAITTVHLTELRSAINSLRACAGLSPTAFASDPLTGGTLIQATHMLQLRTSLSEARTFLGLPLMSFTDSDLAAGTLVRAIHVGDLRTGLK
jgi:hypothetical protein